MERLASIEAKDVKTWTKKVYALVSEASNSIGGLDVAAGICGINAGDLRRSLDGDGRRLSVDHAMAIGTRLRRYNATLATRVGSALVYTMQLDVFPRVTMTAEEENRRLKAKLMAIGASIGVGGQLVEDALGGGVQ